MDDKRTWTIVVREAAPADMEAIAAIAAEVWPATYRDLLDEDFIATVLARTYDEASLRAAIAEAEVFLVAESGGRLVGYLQYGDGPKGPELHRLYVAAAAQGNRVGAALLDALEARLAAGVRYVALVHAGNEGALRFYARHGFSDAGRIDGRRTFLERSGLEGRSGGCDVLLERVVPERPAERPRR